MAESIKSIAIAEEAIISKIYWVRDRKVMLDYDLSENVCSRDETAQKAGKTKYIPY